MANKIVAVDLLIIILWSVLKSQSNNKFVDFENLHLVYISITLISFAMEWLIS